jgi:hypothetical protein
MPGGAASAGAVALAGTAGIAAATARWLDGRDMDRGTALWSEGQELEGLELEGLESEGLVVVVRRAVRVWAIPVQAILALAILVRVVPALAGRATAELSSLAS